MKKEGGRVVPGEEKWLVQAVEDIDDEVVVGNRMNVWTWELAVDKYSLSQNKTKQNKLSVVQFSL